MSTALSPIIHERDKSMLWSCAAAFSMPGAGLRQSQTIFQVRYFPWPAFLRMVRAKIDVVEIGAIVREFAVEGGKNGFETFEGDEALRDIRLVRDADGRNAGLIERFQRLSDPVLQSEIFGSMHAVDFFVENAVAVEEDRRLGMPAAEARNAARFDVGFAALQTIDSPDVFSVFDAAAAVDRFAALSAAGKTSCTQSDGRSSGTKSSMSGSSTYSAALTRLGRAQSGSWGFGRNLRMRRSRSTSTRSLSNGWSLG